MPAGAVLAGAVDALKDDQQRMVALRIERALQFRDTLQMVLKLAGRRDVICVMSVKARIDRREIDLGAGIDAKAFGEVHHALQSGARGRGVAFNFNLSRSGSNASSRRLPKMVGATLDAFLPGDQSRAPSDDPARRSKRPPAA